MAALASNMFCGQCSGIGKDSLVSHDHVLSRVVPVRQGGMALGMQTPGIQFMGQPQFMGMRPAGPQYTADMQKQMAEEHQ